MKLTTRTGILALGNLAFRLGQTLALIAVVRIVSPDAVGTYRQIWVIYNSVYVFFLLGLPGSTYYHLAAMDPPRHRSFLRQTAWLMAAAGAVCAVGLGLLSPALARWMNNPELAPALIGFVPYVFFSNAQAYAYAALVVYKRVKLAAGLNVVNSLGQLVLTVLVLWYRHSMPEAFLAIGVLAGASFIVSTLIVWRIAPPGAARWSERRLREQFGYSVPLSLADATTSLQVQIDKLVASIKYLPAQFSTYSLGAVPLPFITVVRSSIFSVLLSEIPALHKSGDVDRIARIWQETVRKTALLFYPLLAICLISAGPLMSVLYTSAFQEAAIPFRVYLLTLVLMIFPSSSVVLALGLSWFQFWSNLLGLIANATMGVFLARLELVGPAIAAVVAQTGVLAIQLGRISRELGIPLPRLLALRPQLPIMASAALAALASAPLALLGWGRALTLCVQVVTFGACYLLIAWRGRVLTATDYEQIRDILRSLKPRAAAGEQTTP